YFAKKFTQKSLPDIGRNFGGRDHATVIHAVKQVENFIKTDSKFADEINRLYLAMSRVMLKREYA
ncbi:chromosomal replication initiation protein, partial [Wolbachia endosymbiont of Drosophila incompta]